MSASSDLQLAVSTLLGQSVTVTLGDGVATVLPLPHGLGMKHLPALTIRESGEGGRLLVLGTDYRAARANVNTLQVTSLIGAPAEGGWTAQVARLRAAVPIVEWKAKDLAKRIEAAKANHGLCIYVMPPLETQVKEGFENIFFEKSEVRVRIIEQTSVNLHGVDAYDLKDDVMVGLHWQWPAMLKHPLYLARRPCEEVADPKTRILDVIFNAVYGAAPLPPVT